MDHWGDPWADANANDSPTKDTVASPPPQLPSFAPAPVLLNGFLDDAQWGSSADDTLGGGWSSPQSPEKDDETRVNDFHVATGWEDVDRTGDKDAHVGEEGKDSTENNAWGNGTADIEELRDVDNVVSETSDSATTIQPDDAPTPLEKDPADLLHPDDDLSTRSSTSPSDTSRNDVATESPRTSFEDERAAEKALAVERDHAREEVHAEKDDAEIAARPTPPGNGEGNDDFGDFEDNVTQDEAGAQWEVGDNDFPGDKAPPASGEICKAPAKDERTSVTASDHSLDRELLSQLFPAIGSTVKLSEAPPDPVHSTSTRKAWYRLARKQTMREYNNGAVDDNYIRITWKTSHVRSEVIKTVSRWATEDRLAGRGPGARASFYWDTPAPENQTAPFHKKKRSSISLSNPVKHDDRQSVPQLDTSVPAAFNWSSPSAGLDPWSDATNALAVSSPVAPPKHTTVATLQRQGGRPTSVDLTPRPKDPASHKRTFTNVDLSNAIPIAPIEPPKPSPVTVTDPWASLSVLDTNPPPKAAPTAPTAEPGDDDDEWGEMVESPAVSSAQTITEFPPPTRNNTLSTPSTTPRSAKSSPLQPLPLPSGSKHASPIVRLKGTVSPTSALFKPNAFVPASTEDRPIGPSLLKPRNRSAEGTQDKARTPPRPVAQLDEVLHEAKAVEAPEPKAAEDDNDFSAFEASLPSPSPSTPPPTTVPTANKEPLPLSPPVDQPPQTWSDADLSLFESSFPGPTSAPAPDRAHTPPPTDPSDPWAFFDTPAPAPAPFTRTPPRPTTPPAKQPLTSATSSAQRRKAEEDDVIRGIVLGLPDLGYMLRR